MRHRGGSAGGYTTLAALTFRDFFQGGASYYGVSDIAALARDTHKFESRYLASARGNALLLADMIRSANHRHGRPTDLKSALRESAKGAVSGRRRQAR
jgi:Prolyl oligopeptidase family